MISLKRFYSLRFITFVFNSNMSISEIYFKVNLGSHKYFIFPSNKANLGKTNL